MEKLLIRADGNSEIGSGHIMRCSAIAQAAWAAGIEVLFAVSNEESAALACGRSFECELVGGDPKCLAVGDGIALAKLAVDSGACCILVDSYAVGEAFFKAVGSLDGAPPVVYIDDSYTFAEGFSTVPRAWPVDCVISYGFGFSQSDYSAVYGDSRIKLLIGPAYAPVRASFVGLPYKISEDVSEILVTSGSTNPGDTLERMVSGCMKACPDARIDIVIGSMAGFDEARFTGGNLKIHRGLKDLSNLMLSADIAVAAAGSTLYELCCIGVPTVALPIVENQIGNARGYASAVASHDSPGIGWDADDVAYAVGLLAGDAAMRSALSARCRGLVDGGGAARIARNLENIVNGKGVSSF